VQQFFEDTLAADPVDVVSRLDQKPPKLTEIPEELEEAVSFFFLEIPTMSRERRVPAAFH
jgi:hypothetical protein